MVKNLVLTLVCIASVNAAQGDWTANIFRLTSGDPTVTGNPRTVVVSRVANAVVLVIQEGGRMGQRTKILGDDEFETFAGVIRRLKSVEEVGDGIGYWVACEYLHEGKVAVKTFLQPIPGDSDMNTAERNDVTAYGAYRQLIQKSAQQGDAPEPASPSR